jgi:predicted MFS family arabinose efflux permease
MFQALRVPDFRLLWGGGLVSSLGSWLLVLAVPAHVLAVTGSLRDTGLTLAAEYLPQLALGPVAGAVADTCDRRRLMIWTNVCCAGAVAVMLLGTAPGRYWVLYAALAAESTGTAFCAPAAQARVPAVVGTGPLLASANSLTTAGSGIVRLVGGPLGGFLLEACGIRWLICADIVSYLLAATAMAATSRPGGGRRRRGASPGGVARELAEGMRLLRGQPAARALLPVTVIFLTANAALSAVLIPFGIQRLGGSGRTGLLLSCLGAGFLLGAPVTRWVLDRAETRTLLAASLTATAGGYVVLFTASSPASAPPAAAAVGMSGSMSLVVQQTAVQRAIPGAALGRVSAVFLTAGAAATLAGSVAGPFLAQAADLAAVAVAAGLATLGAAWLAFRTVPRSTPEDLVQIQPAGRRAPGGRAPSIADMSSPVLADTEVRNRPPTIRPYLLGALAALSAGAAAIHFAVVFEHFEEYALYGVFFLVLSWAQLIWPVVLVWRPSRPWLWLGIGGNAVVLAVYVASRTVGLPFGPDLHNAEAVGALDVVSCVLEAGLIAGCAALLWRPSLADRPAPRRGTLASAAALLAVPLAVIAATTAVMTPGWAGPEGPAGMDASMASGTSSSSAALTSGMGDMGSTDGLPDMQMYGSTAAPTAAQVVAAAQLIQQTDNSLRRYANVQAAFAAGYTYVLKTNGEEHLLYDGPDPAYQGLNPQDPSSLVYAINVPHHAPVLLGAMYIMGGDQQNGPQVGGGLTRWHSHLVTCVNGQQVIAGFGVQLRGGCDPATWQDRYTAQMLHVWVVPYPGGVFSDDLSAAATSAAVQAALAGRSS